LEKIVKQIRKREPNAFISIQIVVNFPEETEEDIKEGINFYSNLPINYVLAVPLLPIKGTPVYNKVDISTPFKCIKFMQKGMNLAKRITNEINSKLDNTIYFGEDFKKREKIHIEYGKKFFEENI